jgi:hypothetical protein
LSDSAVVWADGPGTVHIHDLLSAADSRIGVDGCRAVSAVAGSDFVAFVGEYPATGLRDVCPATR